MTTRKILLKQICLDILTCNYEYYRDIAYNTHTCNSSKYNFCFICYAPAICKIINHNITIPEMHKIKKIIELFPCNSLYSIDNHHLLKYNSFENCINFCNGVFDYIYFEMNGMALD